MESLIAVLRLAVETVLRLVSIDTHRADKDKHKLGKILADTVIQLDRILARGEIILAYVDRAPALSYEQVEVERLFKTVQIQVSEVESLCERVYSLWSSTEDEVGDKNRRLRFKAPTRVLAIFGDSVYDLPRLLSANEADLRQLCH